ncbi:MAG: hypothetical protein NVS2B12_22350 [Ktedonobacteraceae bacterium]
MEIRPTRTSRTAWLYFIPLLALVLGFMFIGIANSQPYIPGEPDTFIDEFFWTGALILFGIGILGGIISFGVYIWQLRGTRAPQ